jgi:hypothetical protein
MKPRLNSQIAPFRGSSLVLSFTGHQQQFCRHVCQPFYCQRKSLGRGKLGAKGLDGIRAGQAELAGLAELAARLRRVDSFSKRRG